MFFSSQDPRKKPSPSSSATSCSSIPAREANLKIKAAALPVYLYLPGIIYCVVILALSAGLRALPCLCTRARLGGLSPAGQARNLVVLAQEIRGEGLAPNFNVQTPRASSKLGRCAIAARLCSRQDAPGKPCTFARLHGAIPVQPLGRSSSSRRASGGTYNWPLAWML